MPLRRVRTSATATALVSLFALLALGCSSSQPATAPLRASELQGDPALVAAAAEVLEARAVELREVEYVRTMCIRHEIVAGTGTNFVSEGPLNVRRSPATLLFRPGGARALQILETDRERLVVDVSRTHASRWTYDRNGRAIAGVASILLDLNVLAAAFEVELVDVVELEGIEEYGESSETLKRVVLRARPDSAISGVDRLELMFAERQSIPRRIRTIDSDGGTTEFELLRTTLDPAWRDPDVHFELEIPRGFTVSEED